MINEDLITFIQSQAKKNRSQSEISSRLAKVGWHIDDIEEGFRAVALREPAFVEPFVEPKAFNESSEPITTITIPSLELEARNSPDEPYSLTVQTESPHELQVISPVESILPQEVKEEINPASSSSIIFTQPEPAPVASPIIPLSPKPPIVVDNIQTSPIIPQEESILEKQIEKEESVAEEREGTEIEYSDMATVSSTPFSVQTSTDVHPIFVKKKPSPASLPEIIPTVSVPLVSVERVQPPQTLEDIRNNLPQSAIITTYAQAMMASKNNSSPVQVQTKVFNKKKFLIVLGIVVVLSIIAGVVFAFKVGYISLPSLVKKDPKTALLDMPSTYDALSSYKYVTTMTISLPLIANITNGLVSGDPTQSKDKDSISLNIQTAHNKNPSPLSDSRILIQSSLVKNDIVSEFISDPLITYATIPNLAAIIKKNTPPQGIVSIKREQFDSLFALFPNPYLDKIRQSALYKAIVNNKSEAIKDKITPHLSNLIKTAAVTQKPEETIRGVATYHYLLTFERQEVKKFLSALLEISELPLTETEKTNAIESFGSTTGTTLDIWVDKDASMVYRYKLRATLPLSKVLNLDDKGISGNEVAFDWQTEFFDINVPTTITIPVEAIPTPNYLNMIKDIKLKTTILDLPPSMMLLRNAEGSYGKRTNSTGSCTNPNPSSVFSPVGHSKGATNAIGMIADSMKTILNITNGAGACYSTQTAWAASFPLVSNAQSSYCIDSTGELKVLTTPLTGTTCK